MKLVSAIPSEEELDRRSNSLHQQSSSFRPLTSDINRCGNAVLNRFLSTDIGEIRIFSRDEKKQDDMRHDFQARMPEVANKIS